jgi:hypothetical protein
MLQRVRDLVRQKVEASRVGGSVLTRSEMDVLSHGIGLGPDSVRSLGGLAVGVDANAREVCAERSLKMVANIARQRVPALRCSLGYNLVGTLGHAILIAAPKAVDDCGHL